jgi:CysZ protein
MLFIAFFKSLRDLTLPGILKIFLWCLLAYVAAFTALAFGLGWLLDNYVDLSSLPGFVSNILAGAGGFVIAWFMFPLLYPILVSFFDEEVAAIIDAEDYPTKPKAVAPFWPTLAADTAFTVKALALNALCLPLFFIPLVGIALYYGLNGYLLGTQFFRMAAGRRVSRAEATLLEKQNATAIMLSGVGISFMATIPVINLAAPILGVATMLHLFYLAHDKR